MVLTNNIFSKKSGYYAWPQFRILGVFAAIYGAYGIYSNGFALFGFEIILILAGIVINLLVTGIQIDFTKKTYRKYISIFNYRFGKWVKLPEIEYVTVFREQLVKQGGVQSLGYSDRYKVLHVRLVVSESEFYEVGIFHSTEEAFDTAKQCAIHLNTRLLDYTDPKPKWVDPEDID